MKIISITKTKERRKMLYAFFVVFIFAFVNIFSNLFLAEAAFNKQINYQGKLTDASNVSVSNGTYNMEFKLYTASSGGTAIWTETRINTDKVQVSGGLFSVLLGEVNSLAGVDFNQTLYLGVNIGGTGTPGWDGEMTPRKKLGAVPAAVMAETVTGAAQSAITSLGTLTGLTVTGGSTLRGLTVDNATTTQDRIAITAAAVGAARFDGTITNADLTAARTWTLPDNSGTLALTSDLTSGYVPYTGGTSNVDLGVHNLTVDTNSLFVDSVNHRVGIGMTGPAEKLDLSGNMHISAGNYIQFGTAGTHTLIKDDASNGRTAIAARSSMLDVLTSSGSAFGNMRVSNVSGDSGASGNLTLDSTTNATKGFVLINPTAGNVGIGTTTPSSWLNLYNATTSGTIFNEGLKVQRGTVPTQYGMYNFQNGWLNVLSVNTLGTGAWTNFARSDNGTTTTSSMVIDNNGKVGISNTAPGELLTLGTAGTTAGVLSLAGGTSGKATIVTAAAAGTPVLTLPTTTGTLALTSDIPAVTGFVPYTGGTSNVDLGVHNLTVDTNSLFVDSVNHRVGVGTTSPSSKFTVSGGDIQIANNWGAATDRSAVMVGRPDNAASMIRLVRNGASYGTTRLGVSENNAAMLYTDGGGAGEASLFAIGTTGAIPLIFGTNNAERIRIDNAGNVGIGTATPGDKLDVSGNINIGSNKIYNGSAADSAGITFSGSFSNIYGYNGIKFYSSAAGMLSQTERMRLSQTGGLSLGSSYVATDAGAGNMIISGNLGIGTTSPTARLMLPAGTATLNTAPLKFTSGTNLTTAETGAMEYDGTNLYFTPTGTTRKTVAYTSDIPSLTGYILATGATTGATSQAQVFTNGVSIGAGSSYTGAGAVTLSSAAASALNVTSGTTGALNLDSGTTGAINIGTNVNAKTITIGNANDDTFSINSSGLDVSTAGALSGITTLGMSGQLTSTLATGTSPFAVTSTTVNTNLNADLLDGNHASAFQTALTNPVTGTGNTNEIAYFTGASTIGSLAVATYPSLTELSYVKGVTSSIQTQLGNKQASSASLTSLAGLTWASGTPFVKMTAAGTFALDTNTYLTSSTGVSSIAGTANQITASAATGAVTLSLPSDLRAPGTFNAVTSIATGAGAGTVRISSTGVGTFITGTTIGSQTFTTNNISDSGALTINSNTTNALTLDSGTTGAINIGTNANAKTISIGTGAVANTITIGSASATGVSIADNNWSVTAAGAASFVGVNSGSGLIQGTGGLTVTGNTTLTGANITGASPLSFDGATADGIKTIFAITDPTGVSKTITFPNATGTVALTSDIPSVTGFVPYTGGTSNVDLGNHNLTVDTNVLFVDSVNHNVGIGTASPTAGVKLQVSGNISSPDSGTRSERFGAAVTASGTFANVFGNGSSVTGGYSSAFGTDVTVTGNYSTAFGSQTTLQGDDSLVLGEASTVGSVAHGISRSIALGTDNYIDASNVVALGGMINTSFANTFLVGSGTAATAANQVVIGANGLPKTDIFFGNGVNNATPSAYTIHGTSGTGTNIAGANITIAGGQGTGTGIGGSILFQTAGAGLTGATTNTLTTRAIIDSTGNIGIGNTSPGELLTLGTAGTKAGVLSLAGATSGKAIIQVGAAAGTPTLTLPTTTGTLALTSDIPSVTGFVPYTGATSNVDLGTYTLTTARAFSTGYDTSWGITNGVNTGGVNVTMGTGANAAWLLSGTSGGTFRAGIQALDSDGSMRFYTNNGSNFVQVAGSNVSAASFYGQSAAVTFGNASWATTIAGSGLTVGPTAWTATPTISGLITATSGLTATTGNVAITAGALTLGGTTRISNTGVGTFITGTTIGSQTFTTNNISDSGALTINSNTTNALTLDSGTTGAINIGTNANAKTISIGTGAVANTITIGSASATGVSITDNNWSVTAAGAANFASVGATTPGTGAFTTLSATGEISQGGYLNLTNDNLLSNGDFETGDLNGWTGITSVVAGGYAGNYTAQITGPANVLSDDYIPVDPTRDVLQLEAYIKKTVAGTTPGSTYFGYIAYNSSKVAITTAPCGTYCYFAASGYVFPVDSTWHKVSATSTGEGTVYPNFPVGTKYIRVLMLSANGGSADTVIQIDHISLKRINNGPLFVGNNFSSTNLIDQYQQSKIYTTSGNVLTFEPSSGGTINWNTASSNPISFTTSNNNNLALMPNGTGNVGIGLTSPTAELQIKAGAAAAGSAPLKFTSGTNLTTAETGAMEYDGTNLYFTPTGTTRKTIAYTTDLSTGYVPYTGGTSNVDLGVHNLTVDTTSLFVDSVNHRVGVGTTGPNYKLDVSGVTNINAGTLGRSGLGGVMVTGTLDHLDPLLKVSEANASGCSGCLRYGSKFSVTGVAASSTNIALYATAANAGTNYAAIFDQGNVGIGTTSPGSKLEVGGNILMSNNNFFQQRNSSGTVRNMLGMDNTGVTRMYSYDGVLFINPDTGTRTSINYNQNGNVDLVAGSSTGNVGIGTVTPGSKLELYGSTDQTTAAITDAGSRLSNLALNTVDSVSGAGASITFGNSQSNTAGSVGWASIKGLLTNGSGNTYGDLAFSTRNATSDTALTERMRILGNGNVGIGTATPGSYKLNVAGGLYAGSNSYIDISPSYPYTATLLNTANAGNVIVGAGSGTGLSQISISGNTVATGIQFLTNNTERLRIADGGNVGIGTTIPTRTLSVFPSSVPVSGVAKFFASDSTNANAAVEVGSAGTSALDVGNWDNTAGKWIIRAFRNVSRSSESDLIATTGSPIQVFGVEATGKVLIGATSETVSSAKLYVAGTTAANGSSSAIAGILGGYTFNPTAGGVQVGNRFVVTNSPTTSANTSVAEMIRTVDNTSLANLVRGLDITSNAGSNTAGTNTGLRASGATFGVQGITSALAGGAAVPAAIYGESTGTTQGDVLRLYSNTMTSATSFATFYHDTSTYTGTGLIMDFAKGSGAFTGNYIDLKNNGASVFKVSSAGVPSVGLSGTASTNAVCSSLANNTAPGANTAYELRDCSGAPAADYAEMYPVESGVEYGDIVAMGTDIVETYDIGDNGEIDWTKIKGNISKLVKSKNAYQQNVIGIVSNNTNNFSSTGYNIKESDHPMPVALNGRVPVKISQSSSPIKAGDYVTTSMEEGKATRALKSGFVIGKALEDWTPESGKNTIMIFVEQGYYQSDSAHEFAGETTFGGLTFFNANVEFAKSVKFVDEVEFTVPPLFNSDTAGFAVIKAGSNRVDVTFDKAYIATPVVNTTITFDKQKNADGSVTTFDTASFFNDDIKSVVVDKDENGFGIAINKIAPQDLRFSWIALAVKNPKVFESVMPGLAIDSTTTPTTSTNSIADVPATDLTASAVPVTTTETVDNSSVTPTQTVDPVVTSTTAPIETTTATTPISAAETTTTMTTTDTSSSAAPSTDTSATTAPAN